MFWTPSSSWQPCGSRLIPWCCPSPFARLLQIVSQWSYSIYLVHPAAYMLWHHFHPGCETHSFAYLAGGIFVMLLASYAFFVLVERPTINLAKLVSKRLLTGSKGAMATYLEDCGMENKVRRRRCGN